MPRARETAPIERSPSPRRLIVSARASRRIAAAREWLSELPRDAEALVLAPHSHAADQLLRSDVAGAGTRFGVHRFTLTRLAARLAAPEMAHRRLAPATTLSLAAVAARAVHAMLLEDAAGRFAEVARRPGFPHALVRTFEELRAAGIPPAALRSLPLGSDLAAILERVEAELDTVGLADRATVLSLARAAVAQTPHPPVGVPLLLLDLPVAEGLEAELLGAIVACAPSVLATVSAGDAATMGRLASRLDVAAVNLDADDPQGSLASLQQHLFEDTGAGMRTLDDSVTLTSWPGEARECVEIARRIQLEATNGTPFDRIAVLLRAPIAYRPHLEEALRRAAIPAYFARGSTRPEPAGRAFLALLACAAEGLTARRFAEYLSLAQVPQPGGAGGDWRAPDHDLMPFTAADSDDEAGEDPAIPPPPDPDAPIRDGVLRAPWRWERLIVDAAVIGGRERWRRRLDGLLAEMALQRSDLEEDDARAKGLDRARADLAHLRDFALPVIDRLAALPAEATWGEWLEHLRGLAVIAIREPATVNAVLAEMDPLAPVGPVDLAHIQHVLAPRLGELMVPPERRPGGAVFVAPADAARGLVFDVVFVPGLAEKVFPPKLVEDPLLPDEARQRLGASVLVTQDERVAGERLALRLAAGAAGRHLALSWPRIDLEQARPRVPSFYGLEALRAAEGHLPGFDELRTRAESGGRARLGWPAPDRPEEAIDDAEYDLAVLARLQDQGNEASVGAAHYLLAANPHLARALRARGRRWLKIWTSADGLVPPHERERTVPGAGTTAVELDRLAHEAIAPHRMGARSYSPTALENFSACPYRFLLQAVHRLQPRQESEPLETIDPLTKGALFHEVQFRVLTALRDAGRLPLDPSRLETAFIELDRAVESVAAEYEERLAPAIPRVWVDGVTAIRADLREWLRRSAEGAHGWVPHRFELSFGLAGRDRPTADAASVPEPVAILDGALLRGSIDLVERRGDGTVRVTDHKTGKARAEAGAVIGGGRILQPVLYALVAEAVLQAPVESGRLYYCTADGDFTERVIPLDDESRAGARRAIDTVAHALENGFLPAAPAKDACRWCDYLTVCGPYEERRTANKPADRLIELTTLRGMP